MSFYSIRTLLVLNALVFALWCLLLLSATNNMQESNPDMLLEYRRLKNMEYRLEKLQSQLKKRYPAASNYISTYAEKDLPIIYAITPTYARWTQKADLTRLLQTILHVPNFHWVVVEDADSKTVLVTNFLKTCGLPYTHLNAKTDANYKLKADDPNWLMPRGVEQRNVGLAWMRKNVPANTNGVLYFMDDDNTYALEMFEELRATKVGSAWPVGLSGGLKFEGPGACQNGKVLSWYTAWKPERPFPIDMAGFAVNLKLIFRFPDACFTNKVPRGYQESHFLTGLHLSINDMEAKANDCSKVIVWHTRTEKAKMKQEDKLIKIGKPSNPDMEV